MLHAVNDDSEMKGAGDGLFLSRSANCQEASSDSGEEAHLDQS